MKKEDQTSKERIFTIDSKRRRFLIALGILMFIYVCATIVANVL